MTAATLPEYPTVTTIPGIDIKVIWRPKAQNFDPQIHTSGREVIVNAALYPLHEFELVYNVLRGTPQYPTTPEFQTFMGFYLQQNGIDIPFQFKNPYDYTVLGQPVSVFPGGPTTQYLLTRTFGAGGFTATEPIGFIDLSGPVLNGHAAFNVYIGGVLQSSGAYTLDYSSGPPAGGGAGQVLLNFGSAPGAAVTVDMSFLYYCRFGDDTLDFEEVLFNVWGIKKVLIVSKRGPAPS